MFLIILNYKHINNRDLRQCCNFILDDTVDSITQSIKKVESKINKLLNNYQAYYAVEVFLVYYKKSETNDNILEADNSFKLLEIRKDNFKFEDDLSEQNNYLSEIEIEILKKRISMELKLNK